MSVNSKMTALADEIRVLSGAEGTMGLDAMKSNVNTANSSVSAALSALVDKGVEVPDGTNVTGLAELIAEVGVDGILASGTIIPSEDANNYQLDTGIILSGKKFVLWYAEFSAPPNASYIAVVGFGQASRDYKYFGINGLGSPYVRSVSIETLNSTIVKLPGSVANYSFTLRAGYKYCWVVYDSTFNGFLGSDLT